jgi:raffinose/stachyose/melibiose transport system permease protein
MFRYILSDYNGFTAHFTGMQNITRMLHDANFRASIGHTFEYALYKITFIIPFALLVAVVLQSKIPGASVFRLVYFLPTVISSSISGMIFSFIFATSNGILNGLLDNQIPWLTNPSYVMIAVTALAVWGGFGNYMLYFITGMNGITSDVYEAAKIDGANSHQIFFKITLPMLSPVLKVVLMLAITSAFKDYEAIMVLSGGGPGNRSMVMFLYIYNLIFGSSNNVTQPQIGYGALLSCVSAIIVGGVTILYLRLSKRLDEVV